MLQDAIACFLDTALVAAHNKRLDGLASAETRAAWSKHRNFRVGMRLERGHPGRKQQGQPRKKDYGIVMHVAADGDLKLPVITVLWRKPDGRLEGQDKQYKGQAKIDQLHAYKDNFKDNHKNDPVPQRISYKQLVETWCAHLSLSLSLSLSLPSA